MPVEEAVMAKVLPGVLVPIPVVNTVPFTDLTVRTAVPFIPTAAEEKPLNKILFALAMPK